MKKYIYDKVPYDIRAYPSAHPRNLAAIGTLYGLNPAPVDQCRVLVLGCAQGGNLFPVATFYPDSQFVGIDNSERQIATAQSTASALGLSNTELHCMDILDIDERMGQFDYIIAHGIYSWIPGNVRDKVFQICKTLLTPNGITYLSYNTLPGWHINGIVRDIMLYRFNDFDDPVEGVNQAIAYLEMITSIIPMQNNAYMFLLKQIQARVSSNNHSYLLHEYLGEINDAFYFNEIVKKGEELNLQYLGDATFIGKEFISQSPEMSSKLKPISRDLIDFEQHVDFLLNRNFRCSLFCHKGMSLHPRILENNPAKPLYFSSMAQVSDPPNGQQPTGTSSFRNSWGGVMVDQNPLFQGAMKHLIAIYPEAVSFNQLVETLLPAYNQQNPVKDHALEKNVALLYTKLLQARAASMISITADKPSVATVDHEFCSGQRRPIAAPFARIQAQSGTIVISAWNENVGLNEFSCHLLTLLDGTRQTRELNQAMLSLYEDGTLNIPTDNTASAQGTDLNKLVEKGLESSLKFFAKSGLLILQ